MIQSRGIKARLFSGTPVLCSINIVTGDTPGFSLLFRNGLMLTLGEAGILDYQDRDFGNFIGGQGRGAAPDHRESLVQLHKIVLRSLLGYITHPGLNTAQRELAAEAATKLWMAESLRSGATGAWKESGYRATRHSSRFPDTDETQTNGSWSMGSPRESAPFR